MNANQLHTISPFQHTLLEAEMSKINIRETEQSTPVIWKINSLDGLNKYISDYEKTRQLLNADEEASCGTISSALPEKIVIMSSFALEHTESANLICPVCFISNSFKCFDPLPLPQVSFQLDSDRVDQLAESWVDLNLEAPTPPLPNITIDLPAGMTSTMLGGVEKMRVSYKTEFSHGSETKCSFYEPPFLSRAVSSFDAPSAKQSYGEQKTVNLPRKYLIDQELSAENNSRLERFLCYNTGTFVYSPKDLDADHVFPKKGGKLSILGRIEELFSAMNQSKEFAKKVLMTFGCFEKRWVVIEHEHYVPSKLLLRDYFNDISNLILIKKSDNQQKSNHDPEAFLNGNKFYRGMFSKYPLSKKYVIYRVLSNNEMPIGLGRSQFLWFRHSHSWYKDFIKIDFDTSSILSDKAMELFDQKLAAVTDAQKMEFELHYKNAKDKRFLMQSIAKLPSREHSVTDLNDWHNKLTTFNLVDDHVTSQENLTMHSK